MTHCILTSMCGRVAVTDLTEVVAEFGITKAVTLGWEPAYNVGPSSNVPVVRVRPDCRRLSLLRWGLLPTWVKDPRVGSRMFNAKVETVAEQPAFSEALRQRRCIVAVSGFFEWQRDDMAMQPFYVTKHDGRPLALAGLWEIWLSAAGEVVETCTIITKPTPSPLTELFGRMPAVLSADALERWLDARTTSPETLRAIVLEPSPDLSAAPISDYVNSLAHQGVACITPVGLMPRAAGGGSSRAS